MTRWTLYEPNRAMNPEPATPSIRVDKRGEATLGKQLLKKLGKTPVSAHLMYEATPAGLVVGLKLFQDASGLASFRQKRGAPLLNLAGLLKAAGALVPTSTWYACSFPVGEGVDMTFCIPCAHAPIASMSPKHADAEPPPPANGKVESPAEVMDRVLTPEPAGALGERSIEEHVRAIKPWTKPYTVGQAILVAESRVDLAVIARKVGVTVLQAKEIRDCWGTANGLADLKKRRDS